jgi:hypothetical protein
VALVQACACPGKAQGEAGQRREHIRGALLAFVGLTNNCDDSQQPQLIVNVNEWRAHADLTGRPPVATEHGAATALLGSQAPLLPSVASALIVRSGATMVAVRDGCDAP